jgi:glycerophosphoryl diester phosphodiesterase
MFDFSITTGNFIAAGDVQSNSDERLKENVETIENALDKVSKLRGVYFDMKSRPGVRKVGLIAQEVENILPEVVSTDSEGDKIKSVAYANMVGLLVEAIKELKDEVDHLKGQ